MGETCQLQSPSPDHANLRSDRQSYTLCTPIGVQVALCLTPSRIDPTISRRCGEAPNFVFVHHHRDR
jgi:hypothetical protein